MWRAGFRRFGQIAKFITRAGVALPLEALVPAQDSRSNCRLADSPISVHPCWYSTCRQKSADWRADESDCFHEVFRGSQGNKRSKK